jgi:hypothetical protein
MTGSMTKVLGNAKAFAGAFAAKAKVRKGTVAILAVCFVLQLYFVRELLAAELLFALGFGVLFILGSTAYLLGAAGERGWYLAEAGMRAVARSARRGYIGLEEISRKSFRHARSESAQ